MPKWAKIAVYGAALAVAVDYFISPATKSALKLR
jgi:hypothetical protein